MTTAIAKSSVERLKSIISQPTVRTRFEDVLGKRAPAFLSSLVSAVASNSHLAECDPMSVVSAAAVAAAMDLPISPSLGLAHIVPYKGMGQFQIGWKGFVQLALRTGQYATINVVAVKDGQLVSHDPFTGVMQFKKESVSEKVIGYLLYFKLLNGFEKYFYLTKEECEAHGKRFSASYRAGKGMWVDDFDSMALKTVCKLGLSKYGLLSVEMQKAVEADQAVIDNDGRPSYIDVPRSDPATPAGSSRLKEIVDAEVPPEPEKPIVSGVIQDMKYQEGKTNNKEWKVWRFLVGGEWYSTFSQTDGLLLTEAADAKKEVSFEYSVKEDNGKKRFTIERLITEEQVPI